MIKNIKGENAKMEFKFSTTPECEDFLKIKYPGEEYMKIEEFVIKHNTTELDKCEIRYRGEEKKISEYEEDYVNEAKSLMFIKFEPYIITTNPSIKASLYYMKKTLNCLQNARFFTIKSRNILDIDYNINWSNGYGPQYLFRCVYFETAATWYSNTFDQLLQAVYWAYDLYTSAADRDGNAYNDSWDAKTIMKYCNYEFVVGELKNRAFTDIRKELTKCSGKIENVRSWANYIKHKGGVDYKYLEPPTLIELYVMPIDECKKGQIPDKKFAIKDFKSPIEIDIDHDYIYLTDAYKALYDCINNIITLIDYEKYKLRLIGGKSDGEDENGNA